MRRTKFVTVLVAVATVTGVALAAPGSVAGAKVAAQSAVRGVTATTITVAGICDPQLSGGEVGAKARFDAENAKGGTFGRKWVFKGCNNDNDDPTLNQSIGKRLVQQDGVFGIVPTLTPALASAPFFAQQHVPFAGWGIASGYCQNPYALGFTGCLTPPSTIKTASTTWGALVSKALKKQGSAAGASGHTAAVISEDNDSGRVGTIEISAQAKVNGFNVVYSKSSVPAPPAVTPDYTPFAAAIMTSNAGKPPDTVFVTLSFANMLGVSKALLEAGYKGILTNAVAYDPSLIKAATGQSVYTQYAVPEDTSPAMQQIVANIKNSTKTPIGQPLLAGYFSADAFIAAVKKAGKNLTPEAVGKVLTKFTYEVKGVIGPTKYPAARTQGTPCGTLVTSNGTAYEVTVSYSCYHNINYETLKTIKY